MVHKDGEKESALAATELEMLYTMPCTSSYSLEEVDKVTNGLGPKLFEIDIRLRHEIRNDLVKRVCQSKSFIGVVINAQYLSGRVTENEWKNDFKIPPHLESGCLVQYKT